MSGKQIMNDNSNQSKRMQMLTLIILVCTRVGERVVLLPWQAHALCAPTLVLVNIILISCRAAGCFTVMAPPTSLPLRWHTHILRVAPSACSLLSLRCALFVVFLLFSFRSQTLCNKQCFIISSSTEARGDKPCQCQSQSKAGSESKASQNQAANFLYKLHFMPSQTHTHQHTITWHASLYFVWNFTNIS